MSLYHEVAQILTTATEHGGSLKSIVFGKKDWKTDRKTLFALSTEAAKWSEVLSEVVEKSELIKVEKQLTPILSLVLAHDLLLSKKGVALPAKHGLHASVARHKARLTSELTKARLRRGCASVDALRAHVEAGPSTAQDGGSGYVHPRWIRVNTILGSLAKELESTFADYQQIERLSAITSPGGTNAKVLYVDPNVPNLVAVPGSQDFSSCHSYKEGRLIFQEKASCFPACLLEATSISGDIIDACAAPGNKTTHLAALLSGTDGQDKSTDQRRIYACEKDTARSQTLQKMVKLAGADQVVTVRAKQDFMKLDPQASEFRNVQALLLDPSCSGSGIVGRDEARVTIHLPSRETGKSHEQTRGKKRKRGQQAAEVKVDVRKDEDPTAEEAAPSATEDETATKLATRLANLSSFQLRLLERAMSFPSARRITYSTCSLHKEENEHVVARALASDVAQERGWRVLRRKDQVEGMRAWSLRGSADAVREIVGAHGSEKSEEVAGACIRCEKGGEGGTMGFFVAAFVRDNIAREVTNGHSSPSGFATDEGGRDEADEEGWEGFSDDG